MTSRQSGIFEETAFGNPKFQDSTLREIPNSEIQRASMPSLNPAQPKQPVSRPSLRETTKLECAKISHGDSPLITEISAAADVRLSTSAPAVGLRARIELIDGGGFLSINA